MTLFSKAVAFLTVTAFCSISIIAFIYHPLVPCDGYKDQVSTTSTFADPTSTPSMGIGFDLTAFYGTAALNFPNGSTVHVAKIEASSEYRKTMTKLSLISSKHPAPPYRNIGDQLSDTGRQRQRRARKAMGLPASDDVATISDLIKDLKSKTEDYLGHSITAAVATTPHLAALYEEDIADAFEYIDLQFQNLPYWRTLFRETGAAYAGYGFGLCANYTDPPACNAEQRAMPTETVMAVLYTKQAITVTLSKIQSILWLWEPAYRYHEDFTLGHDALAESPEKDHYWEYVREALMRIMVDNPYYPGPDKVLLMGECANDETFRHVLEDTLDYLMVKSPEIMSRDAEYVAAKGAGELAKRAPYDIRLLAGSASEAVDDMRDYIAEREVEAAAEDDRQRASKTGLLIADQRTLVSNVISDV